MLRKIIHRAVDIHTGLQLADFFIGGCRNAMEALENGADPEAAFPYITRDGIIEFPFQLTEDGRLEPDAPPEDFESSVPRRRKTKTQPKNKI